MNREVIGDKLQNEDVDIMKGNILRKLWKEIAKELKREKER